MLEHGSGHVVNRELADADLAKGHRRHAHDAAGGAGAVGVRQLLGTMLAARASSRVRITRLAPVSTSIRTDAPLTTVSRTT